jgi:multidrug resistance efflux pump
MNFKAAEINFEVATQQFERMKVLFKEGLRSLTEYESRKLQFQKEQASLIALENIFLNAKNDLISAKMEISAIDNDFAEKIAKTESEIQSTGSLLYEAVGEIAKMENKLSNIEVRQKMYYITSPMNGYITKAIKAGIGENFKEGIELVSIMPANASLAVEMFIEPIDFPLITVGGKVRFIFDGWPAIVFSGWPQLSNGTFGGRVYAIDNFASQNGLYRVLVIPEEEIWPDALRVGSGAVSYALLKDVPVWYELWRQLNGFPPDFYLNYKTTEEKK